MGRNSGMIKELYPPFFFGLGGVMGSGAQVMPWIHVKDLAGIILHSIEDKQVCWVLIAQTCFGLVTVNHVKSGIRDGSSLMSYLGGRWG